jgi:WD40 repeat protein
MPDFQSSKAKLIWQLKFEGPWPTSLAFLGSGSRLAAGNREGQIFVWDLPAQAESTEPTKGDDSAPNAPPVRRLDGHTNGISHLRSTKDGKLLVSASFDHTLRIWENGAAPSGSSEAVLDSESREREARRRPEKERQQVLEAPGVPVETQTAAAVLEGHDDWVGALGMSRDEKRLISGDTASRVIVWDLAARKEIARWNGHAWNWIVATALSPDGQTGLVSEFRNKRDDFDIPAAGLKLWNVADASEKLDILKVQFPKLNPQETSYGSAQLWRKFVADGLIAAEFSPDGKLVAAAQGGETDTGVVHLIDVESGKLVRSIAGHRYGATDVKFSADGKYLLSTGRDMLLQITAVADGKQVAKIGKPRGGQFTDWLYALAVSPDEQYVAATDIAGLIHVWRFDR